MAAMKTTLIALLALGVCLPFGCGKKAPKQQADQPTEATLTPGMEAAGYGWLDPRYSKDAGLLKAQATAKQANRGLWAGTGPSSTVGVA